MPAGFGQHELLRPALEESHAEKVFEHDDMTADGALRDGQAVGGGREAQMLAGGLEGAQGIKRQPFSIHSSSPPDDATLASSGAGFGEHVLPPFVSHARPITDHDITSVVDLQ